MPDSPRIDPQDALSSFRSLLASIRKTGHFLYLLIDEYDNFANELMMGHRTTEESRYQAILSGEGCMKVLFKTTKAAAGGQGLGRVFITRVSPVAMSDLTSGYNVAENIYLLPQFNAPCGFREDEIAAATTQIELTIKTEFLTLLFNDTLYIMESEAEIERGHADLTLIVRPDMRQYQVLDILTEFKFVSLKEAGLDGKTLATMDREALRMLCPPCKANKAMLFPRFGVYTQDYNTTAERLSNSSCFVLSSNRTGSSGLTGYFVVLLAVRKGSIITWTYPFAYPTVRT